MSDSPQAFVLMPFEDAFEPVYEQLIKEPLTDAGYEVTRADSLLNQQSILRDVVRGIADAHLVVADVTGLNENVLYELGLAHALGVRTVMLTQDITELPFDLRPYRANEYSTEFHRAGELRELLREVGRAVLEGSADFSNPVQDFAPDALLAAAQGGVGYSIGGSTSEAPQPVAESGGPTAADVDTEEPGWLELVSEVEQSGEALTRVTNQIGELTRDIAAKIEAHAERLQRASEAPQGQRSAGMLTVAQRSAQDLNTYAESLHPAREELMQTLSRFSEGATSMARHASITDEEDAQAAQEMLQSVVDAAETMGNTVVSTLGFAESLEGVPHVHRTLTNAARGASREVEATAEAIYNAEAELARTRELLEERIEQYQGHSA